MTGELDTMKGISDEDLELIVTAVEPIGQKFPVEKIFLFGSRARGESTSASDYDFIIVPEKNMSIFKFCGLLNELEKAFGTEVDIVSSRAMDESFRKCVEKDKVLVYAK